MNIIFDLDGTLIDSKYRLYNLFQKLVPLSTLSFEEYWDLKSNNIKHKDILVTKYNYSNQEFIAFNDSWMNLIETKFWLDFDKPFHGVTEFLLNLVREKHSLYIATSRQSIQMVYYQLNIYGWENIFKKVLVTQQKIDKFELVKNNIKLSKNDFIIGDMGIDIETGKKLGINTVAVLSGFLNLKSIETYRPDMIINVVTNFNCKKFDNDKL